MNKANFVLGLFFVRSVSLFGSSTLPSSLTFDQFIEEKRTTSNNYSSLSMSSLTKEFENQILNDSQVVDLSDELLTLLKKKNVIVENFKISAYKSTFATQGVSIDAYRKALRESISAVKSLPRRSEKLEVKELELVSGKNFEKIYDSYSVSFPIKPVQWGALLSPKGINEENYQAALRDEKSQLLTEVLKYNKMLTAEEKAQVITTAQIICRLGDVVQSKNGNLTYTSNLKTSEERDVYISNSVSGSNSKAKVSLVLSLDNQCRVTNAKVYNFTGDAMSELKEWDGNGQLVSNLKFDPRDAVEKSCPEDDKEDDGALNFLSKLIRKLQE